MARGSRGRGRGGGGGGSRGGRGGYMNKKMFNSRGRGRGRGGRGRGRGRGDPRQYSELDDLENADFVSVNPPQGSMMASAARTSRNRKLRMQDEVFQTEDNIERTMKLPLRQRPVEFVKANIYDPTQDLIKQLSEKTKKSTELKVAASEVDTTGSDGPVIENTNDEDDVLMEVEEVSTVDTDNTLASYEYVDIETESIIEGMPQPSIKAKAIKSKNKLEAIPDDMLFFIDDKGDDDMAPAKEVYVDTEPQPIQGTSLEYEPTISIGNVLLTTLKDSKGNVFTSLPKHTPKLKNLKDFNADSTIYELDDDSQEDILESDQKNLYKSYEDYLRNVMGNLNTDDESDDGDGIYDELDSDFEEEAEFIASAAVADESDSNDNESLALATETLKIDSEELKLKDEEPEYGYLPEDYETFDNNLVETIQIRYGSSSNKYLLKCFMMTGTYEFLWIDQDILEDFLLENGMPEHRINAYLKFIEKQLTPDEPDERDFDFPIDDSSADEEEDYGRGEVDSSNDDSDDEGLEDLINFTKKYDGLRDMEVEQTHTLSTRGKKRKELIMDHIEDEELRRSLQAQFDIRYESKREKKKRWDQNTSKEHQNSQDLCLKYPYTLHIKEIRSEFESFFQDVKRNSLAFPPMDSHGIKTIQKIAYLFNMKSRKFGQGLKQHAVVIKNKRTFRCHPDYHSVNQLMRQRPVFNRTDQKRPRTEVAYEEGKSSRRGNPSKAHVKEGDIVGADAPEISGDNIGRRLLIKMGWSAGQGLGADNRGIPEPVIAKVKKTKLGIR